ncbi:MAG: hypothetical protein WBQ23_16510 [Bacteroidota bacterium]
MSTQASEGHLLYTLCAGIGILVFFLGPALALLSDTDALAAATVGYAGIALFTGGIAARYSFAVASRPGIQLLRNLGVGLVITCMFYGIFLLLYFL